eukprot:scaffold24242_cov66-Phaeocystis_antarctica.AAC.4
MGGDCSAEGGTREGRVRGTLGPIGFIARLAPIPPYCALFSILWARGVASYYAYEYAYVPCEHGGVFGSSAPVASPAWHQQAFPTRARLAKAGRCAALGYPPGLHPWSVDRDANGITPAYGAKYGETPIKADAASSVMPPQVMPPHSHTHSHVERHLPHRQRAALFTCLSRSTVPPPSRQCR